MAIRPALIIVHRWIGLFATLWLFVLGVTGSIFIFYNEPDRALNPELRYVVLGSERLSAGEIIAATEAYKPGSYGYQINYYPGADTAVLVRLRTGPDGVYVPGKKTRIGNTPHIDHASRSQIRHSRKSLALIDLRIFTQFAGNTCRVCRPVSETTKTASDCIISLLCVIRNCDKWHFDCPGDRAAGHQTCGY